MKSSFFSQSSLCVYIYCDLSSCAQSVAFICWGKKRRRSAKSMPAKPEASKCVLVRKNRKSTHPLESLFSFHLSFRQLLCVRLSLRTGLFFSLFSPVRTRNSSFLKHRIHPKHGSGRTSSLTRSNTRKCISSSFYFVFFSFVEFFFKQRAKLSLLFFLSV